MVLNAYPAAFSGLASLDGLFILLELTVKMTPTKADDKWYEAMSQSYCGKFIKIITKIALKGALIQKDNT